MPPISHSLPILTPSTFIKFTSFQFFIPYTRSTTMSLLLNLQPSSHLLSHKHLNFPPKSTKTHSLSFSPTSKSIFSVRSSYSTFNDPTDPPSKPENPAYVDEWGEKTDPDPEPESKFSSPDPPKEEEEEEEWGGGSGVELGNGSPVIDGLGVNVIVDDKDEEGVKLWELKRALVDTVNGSDLGLGASREVRAEVLELVLQLEAANPIPAPTESPDFLDGNWVLVYTAFSELLPLLAAGSIPLVKVEKISQYIDTSSLTIENSTTLSTPISDLSFSASASFEVQSPSRIQVEFKEGIFKPPEIKLSCIDLPESINIFGKNINLSPLQQSLISPVQNAVEGIARTISGQLRHLKIPIRTKPWLLITYLDKDVRISRGDGGGLFVLVKEGSPLLDY